MKNFLNLNQLSMSWNEKQTPQRAIRYAAMLIMLLTLGMGQMWASEQFDIHGGYVYFDNTTTNWSSNYIQFLARQGSWSGYVDMNNVANTNLYVCDVSGFDSWGKTFWAFAVVQNSTKKSNGNTENTASTKYTGYKNDYGLNSGYYYIISPSSSSNGCSISVDCPGNAATSMNKTITIAAKVSTNNGGSYSNSTAHGTLTGSSNKFSNYNTCGTGTSATLSDGSSSTTMSCGYRARTILTAADKSGYSFKGWYDASGNQLTTNKKCTVYVTGADTYYAYYNKVYSIAASSTVVWDLAGNEKSWSAAYLYTDIEGGSTSSTALTQCGTTTQYAKSYASALNNIKVFLFRGQNGNTWSDYMQTPDYYENVSGVTLYTFNNSYDGKKLQATKTTNAKKATSGIKVYFDKTAGWDGEIWLKYGTSIYNRHTGTAASKVTGTENLYVITIPNDCYYEKYVLTDNYGWTGRNSITADNNISHRIAHQTTNIDSEITYIPTTGTGSGTAGSPKVWSFNTISGGHKRTLTFGDHDNGNITVRYTDESGVEHTVSSASASSVDVAQTCNVVITAVPNSGYAVSGLELNSSSITSGATQTIRADGTIEATFVAEETHDVTVSYKYGTRSLHDAQTFEVGVTTASDISAEAIDGFSFSNWSNLTNVTNNSANLTTNPININTIVSGSDGSMVCNYTPWTCSLDLVASEGATGKSSRTAMSYDATTKAYYLNRTTGSSTERYRFYINSIEYAPSALSTELQIDGTKVTASTDVTSYASSKPSVYFNDGGSGSNITIWFDYENKKAWVTEQKHTVTISAGDNGEVDPTSVSVGNVVASSTISATADDHYHWSSWDVPSGVTIVSGSGTKDITIKATADSKTVTALFAGDVYTITYKDQGDKTFTGSQTTPPTTHTYGTATTLKIPTKTGYDFGGWFTASNCASGAVGNTTTASLGATAFTGNITLYAKWTAKNYSGTSNLKNEDEETEGGYNVDYDGTSISFTTGYEPSKTGYEIEGFYTNAACTVKVADGNRNIVVSTTDYTSGGKWKYTSAPDLYIHWRAKTYTVILDDNGSYDGNGSATATYDSKYLTDITLPTRTGYHVPTAYTGGFFNNDELNIAIATRAGELKGDVYGYTDILGNWTRDEGATLYAKWQANQYTVRYHDNHEQYIGYASGSTTLQTKNYDEVFTLRKNGFRLAGYSFLGWATTPTGDKAYDDEDEVSNLTDEENGTFDLYALWDPQLVNVTFYIGSGTCATTSTNVVMGENYGTGTGLGGSLPEPTPPTGYVFTGWEDLGGNPITSSTRLTNGNAHTLYAQYAQISYVYFYNNLNWENVYVTYDAYWDNTRGTGNYGKIYHQMELVTGTTNIYRDEIPASILGSWKGCIAFNNVEEGTIGDNGGYGNYINCEVVYRHDFDSYATMFVPDPTQKFTKSWDDDAYHADYISSTWTEDKTGEVVTNYRHSKGYWTQYKTTNAGYVMKGDWDSWNKDNYFMTSTIGETTYTTTKYLEEGETYEFLLYKHCTTSNTYSSTFTNTSASAITSAACSNLTFSTDNTATGSTRNSSITTTVAGDYKFTLTCGTDGVLKLSVRYPVAVGDYRVVYEWNDGEDDHAHVSEVIQADPETEKKMTFFVHKAADVTSQALRIQKCTSVAGTTATWTNDKDNSGSADDPVVLSDVTKSGLYNFIITQPASGEPTGAYDEPYDGPIYLRSDANSGSWNSYKGYLNRMTYSPYSLTQTLSAPYSHYYCTYISDAITNIAFTIATDYSPSICDTLVGDDIIGTSPDGPVYKHLPSGNPANIRFTWNQEDNSITRSYLKSAKGDGNKRFLVLHGKDSHILSSSGSAIAGEGEGADQLHANELLFEDQNDWVYQVNLKATPIAQASLIAKYNGSDRYLVGGADKYETILGADDDGETPYPLSAIYDFKSNRLMVAWTPDETAITDKLEDVDMLWVRHASNLGPQAATQINIGTGGSLTDISIVGAIEFQYNEIVGNVSSWTSSTRNLLKHFVSFPFDVNVADIFGLNGSELGREYVIQKYNGAKRAKDGLFGADGSYFWEYLTADSVMHAGEGYIVMMDNDYIGNRYHDMWENKSGTDKIYLYFPATKKMNISNEDSVVIVPKHTCKIDRPFKVDSKELNHKNTDSHWNMIGSPFFHNSYIKTSGTGETEADSAMSAYYYLDYSYNEWRTAAVERSTVFKAMSCVMVQWQGPATWTIAAPPSPIVARRTNEPETNLLKLELLNNNQTADWVFVDMKEGANADFVLCEDLYKITSSRTPSIYAFAGDYDVSYSQVPKENQTIPLGVIILQNGTYTFSVPEMISGTATLIDTFDGTRTNLALDDYTVNLQKGTINDRFFLEINVNDAPTAIDGVEDGSGSLKDGKAHKFIMNDQMYILLNGVMYDARGARVK